MADRLAIFVFLTLGVLSLHAQVDRKRDVHGAREYVPTRLVVPPAAEGERLSTDYIVEVNGKPVPVYTARVNDHPFDYLDHGGAYSFVSFDFSGQVTLRIHADKVMQSARIRPVSKGIRHRLIDWNTTSIHLDKPCQLSFEPEGKRNPLLIFANPLEADTPKKDDPSVIYFGPGVHRPPGGIIEVKSNQTLYVAAGAVLQAAVVVNQAENVTIRGRGVICGNLWPHLRGPARYLVNVRNVKKFMMEGVTLRGSYCYNIATENSENITIQNVKICGGRVFNDDGIDPVNSRHVLIRDCFIRTDDDCIALKGENFEWGDVDDVRVEDSTLWCDRALIIRLACESRARFMQNIVFKNLDVVHFVAAPFVIMPGEDEVIQNIRFEDIRLEGEGQWQLAEIHPSVNTCSRALTPGHIRDIFFKDIKVSGQEGRYTILVEGYDPNHLVQNVTFENVTINGKPLASNSTALRIGKYVSGVHVIPEPGAR